MLKIRHARGASTNASNYIIESLRHGIGQIVQHIVGNRFFVALDGSDKGIEVGDFLRLNTHYPLV